MLRLRPGMRMPWWAAVASVAAAYLLRSGIRGWDFRPDMPIDAVVLIVFLGLMWLTWLTKRSGERQD